MVKEVFEAATSFVVGDGASTFFWLDKWLLEGRLKDLAPHLFTLIPKRLSRSRLVKECLDGGWLDDIPADLDALAIDQLLAVADRVEGPTITEGVPDVFLVELGSEGDLLSAVLLPRHVSWEHCCGRCPASLEIPCTGQM
jgi:hypothetical protein